MMKLWLEERAFTLVEMLIYMSIFALAATTITGILVTTVRVQNQEIASTEVTQQLNFVLNTVQRLVAQSSEVEETYEGTNPSNPCTTFCTLKLRMVPSGTGGLDPTLIGSTASGVYVQQGTGDQTALTNTQIAVNNLKFTVYSTTGGHATVQVNASFSYNSTNPQLAVTKTLQSAVGRVSAATFDSDLLPDANGSMTAGRQIGQTSPDLRWKNIYLGGLLGFGSSATDPTALAAGSVYYNTTSNNLKIWNGTNWQSILTPNSSGNVGIGVASPTAVLNLKAGTATTNTAPLKFTAGTNLTAPEAGAMEFNGTDLYITDSTPTRNTVITGKQTKCAMVESLVAADDNILIFTAYKPVTITDVSCKTSGFTTQPTIALEDDSGNAMTGAPTCGTAGTWASVTAANGLIQAEGLRFDTTNTPAPTTATETLVCFNFTQ